MVLATSINELTVTLLAGVAGCIGAAAVLYAAPATAETLSRMHMRAADGRVRDELMTRGVSSRARRTTGRVLATGAA